MDIVTRSEKETMALGCAVGRVLESGQCLALQGDLGAGKTHFVQGIAQGMGIREPIVSPTFTILNYYEHEIPLQHFDFYRLEEEEEIDALGFDEYVEQGVTVIEWAEKFPTRIPTEAAQVYIEKTGEHTRVFHFVGNSPYWDKVKKEVEQYAISH